MMTVNRLRGFLICQPKPARVRVVVEGEAHELKVNNRSYQKLAETIEAMDAEKLECLDSEGTVLRVMRINEPDAERVQGPVMPAVLANDPHAAMLSLFANELARAYQYATEVAFTKMVECFDRMNDRSLAIEERLERAEALARRLREDQVQDAFERAEEIAEAAGQGGNDQFVNQMAEAFFSGRLQRSAKGKTTNGKANGAPPANGAAKGGAA